MLASMPTDPEECLLSVSGNRTAIVVAVCLPLLLGPCSWPCLCACASADLVSTC